MKWQELTAQLRESIWENEQMLMVRAKLQELDPKAQTVVIASGAGLALLLIFGTLGYAAYSTHSARSEIAAAEGSIAYLRQTAARMEDLRRQLREQGADTLSRDFDKTQPLPMMAEKAAARAAIAKESIEVAPQSPDSVELKLNKVSIKQIARLLFFFENAKLGVAVEKFSLDAKTDKDGYLWAVLHLKKPKVK